MFHEGELVVGVVIERSWVLVSHLFRRRWYPNGIGTKILAFRLRLSM